MSETVASVVGTDTYGSLVDAGVEAASKLIDQANEIVQRYKLSQSQGEVIHDRLLKDETDNERILNYRKWRDETLDELNRAEEEMVAFVRQTLPEVESFNLETEKASYDALRKAATDVIKTVSNFPGGSEAVKQLPTLESLGRRGGVSTTGIPRLRFDRIRFKYMTEDDSAFKTSQRMQDDKKNPGAKKVVSNLTILGQDLTKASGGRVDNANLREHVLAAVSEATQNGGDIKSLAGSPFTFAYTVPGTVSDDNSEGKTYVIELTPSASYSETDDNE